MLTALGSSLFSTLLFRFECPDGSFRNSSGEPLTTMDQRLSQVPFRSTLVAFHSFIVPSLLQLFSSRFTSFSILIHRFPPKTSRPRCNFGRTGCSACFFVLEEFLEVKFFSDTCGVSIARDVSFFVNPRQRFFKSLRVSLTKFEDRFFTLTFYRSPPGAVSAVECF